MAEYYILDEQRQAIPVADVREWRRRFDRHTRRVARTEIGDAYISTVFLGLNHAYGDDEPPMLFETMVFGDELDGEQDRCATWAEAEEMHERMVARVTVAES